jgi:hypothetical protein
LSDSIAPTKTALIYVKALNGIIWREMP